MITLTINGREIQTPRGSTILDACEAAGIPVPTLCYDPDLRLAGSCRMCLVEVKGRPLFVASCVTPAENGMVVETDSPAIIEARKVILELLAARHEFNCQVCEKNGDCKFQDYCYQYGIKETRFTDGGRHVYPIDDPNPFLERDYNKCIMCTRCVRACEEITVARAVNVKNRGHNAKIATALTAIWLIPLRVLRTMCNGLPGRALTSKVSAGKGRAYEVDKVLTTCTYCGTGCTLELNVKDDRVVGVTSNRTLEGSPVNKGALCVKGRFGWDFIHSDDRLTTPLIRENGEFREASWDEALT